MKIEKEFKKALEALPEREKDKLIVRLLKKDLKLMNRLYFDLVDTRTVDELRGEILRDIVKAIEAYKFFQILPDGILLEMRTISGRIADHVFIAKDKFGDAFLNLKMVILFLEEFNTSLSMHHKFDTYKLYCYILDKVFKAMMQIQRLDPDYLVEFKKVFLKLNNLISCNDTLFHIFIKNGLDINWLEKGVIPEDIVAIYKFSRLLRD